MNGNMLKRHVLIYLFAHAVPAAIGFTGLFAYMHLVSLAQYGTSMSSARAQPGYRDGLAVASPKCRTYRSIIKRLARFQRPAKRICVWNEGCHALSGNWRGPSNASN
jgi:hypothetical protein